MSGKFKASLILIVVGFLLIFMQSTLLRAAFSPEVDALALDTSDLHVGARITADIPWSYGYSISVTSTTSRNGKVVSSRESSRYYLVPVVRADRDTIYIDHMVMVDVDSDDFSRMERGVDRFWDWWEDDDAGLADIPTDVVLHIDGYLSKLTKEDRQYLEEDFGADYEQIVLPFIVKSMNRTAVIVIGGIGLILFLVGAGLFVPGLRANKLKKQAEAERKARIQASGYYTPPEDVSFDNGSTPENGKF